MGFVAGEEDVARGGIADYETSDDEEDGWEFEEYEGRGHSAEENGGAGLNLCHDSAGAGFDNEKPEGVEYGEGEAREICPLAC